MTHFYGSASGASSNGGSTIGAGARRAIEPPRRARATRTTEGAMADAARAAIHLETIARECQEALAQRELRAVHRAIGLALDAIEAIESGLALEFPPIDPGQRGDNRGAFAAIGSPRRGTSVDARRADPSAGPSAAGTTRDRSPR